MSVFLVDNYDSFTYNLVEMLRQLGVDDLKVCKNDQIDLEEVARYSHIIFSPGPGVPSEAPIMFDILQRYANTHAILGVCLGHQAIAEFYGAKLYNMGQAIHGIKTEVRWSNNQSHLFAGIAPHFYIGLYHSWAVSEHNFPKELQITALLEDTIQAIEHKHSRIAGVQFHPESIMTPDGKKMLENFLSM